MPVERRLLVVQVAALAYDLVKDAEVGTLRFSPMETVFPAVTCAAQASFRTAAPPSAHGMVGNGRWFDALRRPMFWEQSSALVAGKRIWQDFRAAGKRVGMLFWQQSLGEDVDLLLSPAPIHKHHGGMIEDCYGVPDGLYARLCEEVGEAFRLRDYWGPLAGAKVGDWISWATASVMQAKDLAPDLLLTYLPSLDYDLQRYGPGDRRCAKALEKTKAQLARLLDAADDVGYDVVVFGDYAIAPVERAVFPNRVLREKGLMTTRDVKGMLYPDFHRSRAFAVVDHEVAHVHLRDAADAEEVAEVLGSLDGVGELLDADAQRSRGIDHPHAGQLTPVAAGGAWFAYPWWDERREAPEFATHVDIHNKPGFDPCELFFGRFPRLWEIGLDASRIRGSHGRTGGGREVAFATTCRFENPPRTLIELAAAVKEQFK